MPSRCILSKFYIKPQLRWLHIFRLYVVSYRNSTSNHNYPKKRLINSGLYLIEILHQTTTIDFINARDRVLYLIEILHQTTTSDPAAIAQNMLYLIEILHQTTTQTRARAYPLCCILSKFYIKPQQAGPKPHRKKVVSYRNSTSNHNSHGVRMMHSSVVSYRNSTSNHNRLLKSYDADAVVSYRNSTSNHNSSATTTLKA